MTFIEEIREKQKAFRNAPIPKEQLDDAIQKIKEELTRIADDPYKCNVSELTIDYEATGDSRGTCRFWTSKNRGTSLFQGPPLFYMTVPHFRQVIDELHHMGFAFSAEYGPTSGHVKLKW